jgi:Lar family restriction alleviation protein
MSEELLPCPFCVGRSLVYEHWNEAGHQTFHVKCLHCGATTDYWGSREEVVNIWNTRHVVCKTTKEEIEEAKAWRKEKGNSWGKVITEPLDFEDAQTKQQEIEKQNEYIMKQAAELTGHKYEVFDKLLDSLSVEEKNVKE